MYTLKAHLESIVVCAIRQVVSRNRSTQHMSFCAHVLHCAIFEIERTGTLKICTSADFLLYFVLIIIMLLTSITYRLTEIYFCDLHHVTSVLRARVHSMLNVTDSDAAKSSRKLSDTSF